MNGRTTFAGSRSPLGAAVLVASLPGLVGCQESTGPERAGNVSVAFRPADGARASAAVTEGRPAPTPDVPSVRSAISSDGSNGTLTVERAHVVVEAFELPRRAEACDDWETDEDDDCEELRAGPRFVELPLNDGSTVVVTQRVPAGTYLGVEFEVDDPEDDGGRDSFLRQVRGTFSDWPADASLRVEGSFSPSDGGESRSFVAYVEAEIEIGTRFPAPLQVGEGTNRTVALDVAPLVWFTRPDGSVVDLSRFDYRETGRLAEIEMGMADGFVEIELDD